MKKKSRIIEEMYESMRDLHAVGVMSDQEMNELAIRPNEPPGKALADGDIPSPSSPPSCCPHQLAIGREP